MIKELSTCVLLSLKVLSIVVAVQLIVISPSQGSERIYEDIAAGENLTLKCLFPNTSQHGAVWYKSPSSDYIAAFDPENHCLLLDNDTADPRIWTDLQNSTDHQSLLLLGVSHSTPTDSGEYICKTFDCSNRTLGEVNKTYNVRVFQCDCYMPSLTDQSRNLKNVTCTLGVFSIEYEEVTVRLNENTTKGFIFNQTLYFESVIIGRLYDNVTIGFTTSRNSSISCSTNAVITSSECCPLHTEETALSVDTTFFTTALPTTATASADMIELLPWIAVSFGVALIAVTTLVCCACRRRKRKPYYLRRLRLSKRKSAVLDGASDDAGNLVTEKGLDETNEKTERASKDSSTKQALSAKRDRVQSMDHDDWVEDVSFDGNWIDKDNSSASDTYL